MDNNKIELIRNIKNKIANKEFKILYFTPDVNAQPSASIYEMYFHTKLLRAAGYNAMILTEKETYAIPEWLDEDLQALPHINAESGKLTVNAEDIMVIPEFFTNIMEQTKNLPCTRIVLLQSYDLAVNSLLPRMSWNDFGITTCITTSNLLKELTNMTFGTNIDVKTYNIAIPDYFKPSKYPKSPLVSFVSRNPKDFEKVAKMFYWKYPAFSWISFEYLNALTRKDFAKKLGESAISVWIDRLASHGTFGLESMKSHTLCVGVIPDMSQEYIKENTGIWVNNVYDLPDMIADMVKRFLDGNIPDEVYVEMDKVVANHSVEQATAQITTIFADLATRKIEIIENIIKTEEAKITTEITA